MSALCKVYKGVHLVLKNAPSFAPNGSRTCVTVSRAGFLRWCYWCRAIDKGPACYEALNEFFLDGALPSARHLRRLDIGSDDGRELGLPHVPIGPLLDLRLTASALGLGRFRVALGNDDMATRVNGQVRRNGTVFGFACGASTYMRPEDAHPQAAACGGAGSGDNEDGKVDEEFEDNGPFATDDTHVGPGPDSDGEVGAEAEEGEGDEVQRPTCRAEPDYKSYQRVRDARATHVNQWCLPLVRHSWGQWVILVHFAVACQT